MKRQRSLRLTSIVLAMVLVTFLIACNSETNTDAMESHLSTSLESLSVYKGGKEKTISESSLYFEELRTFCEDLISNATDRLWEYVSPETIADIKNREIAIEMIYSRPQYFRPTSEKKKFIQVDRIFIPLSGYYVFAGKQITVIHGYQTYSATPLINSKGSDKIERLLELVDMVVD